MTSIYVIVRSEGEIDPFAIGSTLSRLGINEKAKLLKSGDYLIGVQDTETADKLLAIEELEDGTQVKAELHPSMNGCKGVIRCPALANRTDEDIKGKLNIPTLSRVQGKGNGVYILTFQLPQPPKEIRVGALEVKVSRFYPRPLLCRGCFVYGHAKEHCRNKPHCNKCGQYHGEAACGATKCRNCGGPHVPTEPWCPAWKQEMAINKIMTDKGIPPIKARALYKREHKKTYITTPRVSAEARRTDEEPGPSQKRAAKPTPKTQNSEDESEDNRPAATPPAKRAKQKNRRKSTKY